MTTARGKPTTEIRSNDSRTNRGGGRMNLSDLLIKCTEEKQREKNRQNRQERLVLSPHIGGHPKGPDKPQGIKFMGSNRNPGRPALPLPPPPLTAEGVLPA